MPWRSQHRGAWKLLCASALLLCNLMRPDLPAEQQVRNITEGRTDLLQRRRPVTEPGWSSVRSSERPLLSQTFAKTDCVARCLMLCTCADGSKKHPPFPSLNLVSLTLMKLSWVQGKEGVRNIDKGSRKELCAENLNDLTLTCLTCWTETTVCKCGLQNIVRTAPCFANSTQQLDLLRSSRWLNVTVLGIFPGGLVAYTFVGASLSRRKYLNE